MIAKIYGKACVWLVYGCLSLGGLTAVSDVMQEGNRLLRCENGEVLMPLWERGLDGRLQPHGTYCYRESPADVREKWGSDEGGVPVRVNQESDDD